LIYLGCFKHGQAQDL